MDDETQQTRMRRFERPVVAFVQGASRGIGLGLARALLEDPGVARVWVSARHPARHEAMLALRAAFGERVRLVSLELAEDASIEAAAAQIREEDGELDLLLNVSGVLHDTQRGMQPERALRDLERAHMCHAFEINAIGPALVIKHMHGLMRHGRRAVIANLSARVGSIGDNRLGGWYSYRASKAALNQLTHTAAIELRRRAPELVCVALHPGTVDTDLSAPFQRSVPPEQLFDVPRAAAQLLDVLDGLDASASGGFFDWAGLPIPW